MHEQPDACEIVGDDDARHRAVLLAGELDLDEPAGRPDRLEGEHVPDAILARAIEGCELERARGLARLGVELSVLPDEHVSA